MPAMVMTVRQTTVKVTILDPSLEPSALPLSTRVEVRVGTRAALTVDSPNSLRRMLGITNASVKASAAMPVPRTAA